MNVQFPTGMGFEFYLFAVIIVLSLIAAIGAWRRPRTLSRDEAEDMFAAAHECTCAETLKLREVIAELQRSSGSQLQAFRTDTQEQLGATRELVERTLAEVPPKLDKSLGELRTTLTTATEEQREHIQRNLGDLTTNVNQALTEARRSQDEGIGKVEGTLQQVRQDIDRASNEVKTSIVELQRQHNEAKAQSAIQLCEALISSLGTLRNNIAAQIADTRTAEMLLPGQEAATHQSDNLVNTGEIGSGPETAPESPQDMDSVPPESQAGPS